MKILLIQPKKPEKAIGGEEVAIFDDSVHDVNLKAALSGQANKFQRPVSGWPDVQTKEGHYEKQI